MDQCKPSVFDSQSFCANDSMSGGIYSTYKHDVNKINYRFIMSVSERSWLIGQAITVMSQSCSVHTVQFPLPSPLSHPNIHTLSSLSLCRLHGILLFFTIPVFFLTYFLPNSGFSSLLLTLLLSQTHTFSHHFSFCGLTSWVERITCLSLLLPIKGFCFAVA